MGFLNREEREPYTESLTPIQRHPRCSATESDRCSAYYEPFCMHCIDLVPALQLVYRCHFIGVSVRFTVHASRSTNPINFCKKREISRYGKGIAIIVKFRPHVYLAPDQCNMMRGLVFLSCSLVIFWLCFDGWIMSCADARDTS